ncbi:MAG: hypothetical protein JXQ87_16175 [Bacteroidia bacterium]
MNSFSTLKTWALKLASLKKIAVFLIAIMGFGLAKGQVMINEKSWSWISASTSENPFKYAGKTLKPKGDIEASLVAFLKEHFVEFSDDRTSLKLIATRESQIGTHYTFKQIFNGVEVYGSEVKVNLRKDNRVSSCFVTAARTKKWANSVSEFKNKPVESAVPVIFYDYNEVSGAWFYEIHDHEQNEHLKVVQQVDGETYLSSIDRNKRGPRDTVAWVYVYNPDPLTTAGVVYGGNYIDNSDGDTEELTAERQLLPITMRYLSDSIWAENRYVELVSDDVNVPVPYSHTDTFDYTRSEDEFEFIMALYHITIYKEYLNSLGFDSLMNYQMKVKPRSFREDNSNFRRIFDSNGEGVLNFGYSDNGHGHVDDAEDADVIVHEYGHAMSYHANLNELNGAARKAIEEGVCDYLAASYSKGINDFRYEYVYSWDGHNEFWEGRKATTELTCKDYQANKIYESGEIYASALLDINEKIGREATDVILVNSLFEYADRMDFAVAAELFIEAELEIYKGIYHDEICSIFGDKYECISEEYCETGISDANPGTKAITVDHNAFANKGMLNIAFKKQFSGAVNVFDASGKLIFVKDIADAKSFSAELDLKNGFYLVVLNDGWELYSERLVR